MSSIDELTQKVEQGDAETQFVLGETYWAGNGIPTDNEKGRYWYTKAAEQGYVKAQRNLGMGYFYNDMGKAIYWCLKAAILFQTTAFIWLWNAVIPWQYTLKDVMNRLEK
ncbi:hypothetical protein FACS189475_01010 [Betaproteobacteria bacterium]|nr:hypothetical protein FACS189475_01010 [Betaproteobacteria bacterium]